MRPCKDCKKAHEMVLASMEYVKVLGFRIRKTEEISETWKKAAQTHAEECVKLREQLHHLRTAAESGMLPQIVKERDALRAECDDLRRVFAVVHGSLGIQQGEHIGNAIDALKKERDCAKAEWSRHEERCKELSAELIALKFPKPARKHPVAVGEWVKRTGNFCHWGRSGEVAQVQGVRGSSYRVQRQNEDVTDWDIVFCEPCDPPEASHDTPEGKAAAESVIRDDRKTEPKPGDTVRLVRVPTPNEYPHDSGRWEPNWGGSGDYMRVHYVGSNINGTRVVRAVFGLEWPLSCVEVVKGGDK